MPELLEKVGVHWKLLLAQAVNFFAILFILRIAVYRPMIALLRERQKRIERGMKDAEEASRMREGIDRERKEVLAVAERESLAVIAEAEREAKQRETALLALAREKEAQVIREAERVAAARKEEAERKFFAEAAELVKRAVAKTVSRAPAAIDASLIEEAVRELKKTPQ